jgi:hypothetical protein
VLAKRCYAAVVSSAAILVGCLGTRESIVQEPTVCIDEAHFNMHTAGGTYAPVADMWRRDGYVVRSSAFEFTGDSLQACGVLVISNALHERNRRRGDTTDWSLPNPSAFTPSEIAAARDWVRGGGGLLLIADHMPMPGAASDLAAAFDVRFNNGFAMDTLEQSFTLVFRRADGLLGTHPITEGDSAGEQLDSVSTFTGQAFQAGEQFDPLLVIPEGVVSLMPDVAWEFTDDTPRVPVGGWLQGAAGRFGDGRIVVLGEAAMFRADVTGEALLGDNGRFALNVMRWLLGMLEED